MRKVPSRARSSSVPRTRQPRRPAVASQIRRLTLESLELRTLMAVLPPVSVTGQVAVSKDGGNDSTPSVAVDPANPQKLVSVWTVDAPTVPLNLGQTTTYVEGAFSIDGGKTWSSLGTNAFPDSTIDFSQSQANGPVFFTQVTDAAVAFGPATGSTSRRRPTRPCRPTAPARSCSRRSTSPGPSPPRCC
jgi:hypothetical protein